MEKRFCTYVIKAVTRGQCSSFHIPVHSCMLFSLKNRAELLCLWWNLFCVEWLQVVCNFSLCFLTVIHSKLEKRWRVLVKAPEEVLISSIHFDQLPKEYCVCPQNKLWLQNFFDHTSISPSMKAHFDKFHSAPKINIILPQQTVFLR